jgi:TonB family protein
MQTHALLIFAALGLSTLAAAQSTPAPAAVPASAGPVFNFSEEIPKLEGFEDAYALHEIRLGGQPLSEDDQVARWQQELKAGRARAGTLAGSYLSYRALTPTDCAAARDALVAADELGSDQAPWALAQLAQNATCGAVDRAQVEIWLKKAVPLDYFIAAEQLIAFYGAAEGPPDPVQQYVYARVAAGYWESVNGAKAGEQPDEAFAPATLLEMEKTISAADRTRAEGEAAKILEQMLKRHGRFGPVTPQEFARGGAGKAEYVVYSMDYRHECQWNLKGDCRGAQRLAFVELTNKDTDFLSCKVELRARDFVSGATAAPLTRQVLLGPKAMRRLLLGDVNEQPEKKAATVTCAPVKNLAANAAAGKCRAHLQGTIDVEQFYPESAKSRGVQGSTVVRYWVPPGSDVPLDAEIATSSGDISLDDAAIATVSSGKFTKDCDYGLSTIRIAFKLQD